MNATSPAVDPVMFRASRYLYRVPLLAWHVFVHLPVLLLLLAVGSRTVADAALRWWARWFLRIFGMRVRREGTPLAGGTMFVANHVSWVDIVALHSQHMMGFVAKHEIRGWPVIGWLATHTETIYLRRGNSDSLGGVMHEMAVAPARRPGGRGLSGGRHPRRQRAGAVPCAHLHRRGGGRCAGAAGGAVLRTRLRSAVDRGVRAARKFHGQLGAPARRAFASRAGVFPGADPACRPRRPARHRATGPDPHRRAMRAA